MCNGDNNGESTITSKQSKERKILSVILILLGITILGLDIALAVLQVHDLGRPLTNAQIFASAAAFSTILVGLASFFFSPNSTSYHGDRVRRTRNLIIFSVLAIIATILLALTLGFYVSRAPDLWARATSVAANTVSADVALDYSDPNHTGNPHLDASVELSENAGGLTVPDNIRYTLKVMAILKIAALLGDTILIGAMLVIAIMSVRLIRVSDYDLAPDGTNPSNMEMISPKPNSTA